MMSVWSSNDLASRSSATAILCLNLQWSTMAKHNAAKNWNENDQSFTKYVIGMQKP